MRRMVLTAAKAMDELGNEAARVWVSAVKAMVPIRVCHIIDEAIQFHGGTGVSQSDTASRHVHISKNSTSCRWPRRSALVRGR